VQLTPRSNIAIPPSKEAPAAMICAAERTDVPDDAGSDPPDELVKFEDEESEDEVVVGEAPDDDLVAVDLEPEEDKEADEVFFEPELEATFEDAALVEFLLPEVLKLWKSKLRSIWRPGMSCRILAPRLRPRASRPELS
jgi:hypothetical protein